MAPEGFDAKSFAAERVELKTSRNGTITRYEAVIPYVKSLGFTAKTLEQGLRFNLMVNDNDGDGLDALIEIVPNAFRSGDIVQAPIVSFKEK